MKIISKEALSIVGVVLLSLVGWFMIVYPFFYPATPTEDSADPYVTCSGRECW